MSVKTSAISYVNRPADCDLYEAPNDRVYLHHLATDTVIALQRKWVEQDGFFARHCKMLKEGLWKPAGPEMNIGNVHTHVEDETYSHHKNGHAVSLDDPGVTKIDHYSDDSKE